jgi:hypothetical protein
MPTRPMSLIREDLYGALPARGCIGRYPINLTAAANSRVAKITGPNLLAP